MQLLGPGPFRIALAAAVLALAARAHAGPIAFDDPRLAAPATLTVSIAGAAPGGAYPKNSTADGRNVSPPVSWTAGPPSTRSYVVLLQDPDAPGADAAVHWLFYNLAPELTGLPRYIHNEAEPSKPLASAQGLNFHGTYGYSGPRPPVGDPPHHYHLQVFALDHRLRIAPGAELEKVERAMAGHVIARGEALATYATPDPNAPHGKPGAPNPAPS